MLIYKAVNKINGKVYIGQTRFTLKRRLVSHTAGKARTYFGNALRRYGIEAFEFSVIDTADSQQELDAKERHWIAQFESLAPKGYNLTDGGFTGGMFKGRKHSPETIRRMSLAQKQRYKKFPFRPETGALLRAANLGRKCSPETCRSMSESRIRFRLPLDELKKRYMNGETTVSLASFYGCSNDIIAKNLRDAGVKIRNQSEANVLRYKKNLPEIEILRRYNSGESVNQIARTFSVTRHAINKLLSEQHVPIRSLDEARIVATGNGVMRQAALNRWARVRSAT